jgi:hypothetical protein
MSKPIAALLVVCALLLLPACAANSGTGSGAQAYSGYGTPGSVAATAGGSIAPGRTAKRGGRVEVVGTLQRDDSGSWLVVGAVPAQASSGKVVGVIVNSASLQGVDLAALENSYVRVTGTASQGIATDKAGLGVIADTVKQVSAP